MAEKAGSTTVSSQPLAATFATVAQVSFWAAAVSVGALAALHVLSPELDPTWRMVSDYALGHYSWVLTLMFWSMSLSCVALFVAIRTQPPTLAGKIGLAFLLTTALGLAIGGAFDVTTQPHGWGFAIGVPSQVIGSLLISTSLVRSPGWSSARRPLLWSANLVWVSLAVMVALLFAGLSQTGGKFGPSVLVGIPNRLVMVCYGAWLMVTAWRASRLDHAANA
jgi:hypothetical protein